MPDKVTQSLNRVVLVSSTASFLSLERVLRDIDRTNNVSMGVESAFAFVPPILRLMSFTAVRTPLRRFVRIDADDEDPRQSSFVLNKFRESVKTPRVEQTVVLSTRHNLLLR